MSRYTNEAVLELDFVCTDVLPRKLTEALGILHGKRLILTLSHWKKKRTLNQNSFFHGAFMDALEAMYQEAGNDHSREEIKEQMKQLFGLKKTIIAPGGMETTVLVSTTKYSTTEIEAFMDKIRAWAAPYNKILPYPNEGRYAQGY